MKPTRCPTVWSPQQSQDTQSPPGSQHLPHPPFQHHLSLPLPGSSQPKALTSPEDTLLLVPPRLCPLPHPPQSIVLQALLCKPSGCPYLSDSPSMELSTSSSGPHWPPSDLHDGPSFLHLAHLPDQSILEDRRKHCLRSRPLGSCHWVRAEILGLREELLRGGAESPNTVSAA